MHCKSNSRYARISLLPSIGEKGVDRLREGKVLVIGCGALGSLCAMYLAGTGVGTIGIADFDTIDITNLQRQLFFTELEVGKKKSFTLCDRLENLNSDIQVICYDQFITPTKARDLFNEYDFIIDSTDNPDSKFMTESVCCELGIPYTIGGIKEFEGQVMSWKEGFVSYSDIFDRPTDPSGILPCSLSGVFGPAAGIVASMQPSEAIKHLTGIGKMLLNRIFIIDLLTCESKILHI